MMLVGRCIPDLKPKPDPWLPFAPSASQFGIEFDTLTGFHYDPGRAPENALADGGLPIGWWPRTSPFMPSDDLIVALAKDLDARIPGVFVLRLVEMNLGTYTIKDPTLVRELAQHWIDVVRTVLPPDRCVFSMCLYPDAAMTMKQVPKFIPPGAQLVGCDNYSAAACDPTTSVGKRAHWIAAAAHALGRVFVTLESGVTPCADPSGLAIPSAVDHAKALVQYWKDTGCAVACVTSCDWKKYGLTAWGDGTLTKNPGVVAALTEGLMSLGAVHGPFTSIGDLL